MSHHDPIQSGSPIAEQASAEPALGPDVAPTAEPRRTDGLAVTSLVLGIAGFLVITIPVALILGVIGFARAGRPGRKGKGLAATGLVLAVLWAAALGVGVMTMLNTPREPERDERGRISAPNEVDPDTLKIGDCVAETAVGEVATVKAVPCGQAGSGKVYAIFDLDGQAWPGDAKVGDTAENGCMTRYTAEEEAELTFLHPTQETWQVGDRRVICIATPVR